MFLISVTLCFNGISLEGVQSTYNATDFTVQHYASTVYAVIICLSVLQKSVFYWNG